MRKIIGNLLVSIPLNNSQLEKKIEAELIPLLEKEYEVNQNETFVGGGKIDRSFTFKNSFNSKEEFLKKIEPLTSQFKSISFSPEYIFEDEYLENIKYQQYEEKRRLDLKKDIEKVYLELKKKHLGNLSTVQDIDHIFKKCVPTAWRVD